jgi:hypothetical protein
MYLTEVLSSTPDNVLTVSHIGPVVCMHVSVLLCTYIQQQVLLQYCNSTTISAVP